MANWLLLSRQIESISDLELDGELVAEMEQRFKNTAHLPAQHITFHTPSFKQYSTSEISGCGKSIWPAVSITGNQCKLQCDHCKAKILDPMIPAQTPETLWRIVNEQINEGARGMLLTGGSNHRNEVEYDNYYSTIRRIKDAFPGFGIAMHTALVDRDTASKMEDAGIDAAMMDVIGSQDTITQVYHLRRSVEDFERSLEYLVGTNMKVVPHIVIGLHYGRLLGEWHALEIVKRHMPSALVLVVTMPFYAPEERPFISPDSHEAGRFFMDARAALTDIPLLLGCARPPGRTKMEIDSYAVMAGLNGIAHPADGIVELASRLDRKVQISSTCCSIGMGEEAMFFDGKMQEMAEGQAMKINQHVFPVSRIGRIA